MVGDLHDLRAFALASDLKSLTAAAKLMGESKATTSRRITRLEGALGVALLRRTPRTVEATDDGAVYRLRVAEVLELLGDANAAARGACAAPSGQLRLTAPPGFTDVLAPVLARFAQAYPLVVLVVDITSRHVDIEGEHFDVALRATSKLVDSSLVAVRVGSHERIAVAAPSYLAARPPPRRVKDLESHRIVMIGDTGAAVPMELTRAGDAERFQVSLATAIAASDVGFVKELVLAGAGIALLPRIVIQSALDDGSLVHVLPSYRAPGVNLYLLHRGGRFIPPKVRVFLDFVRAALDPTADEPGRRVRPGR
jgi:DNA-binding transcriptional LysR family regulator